MNICDLLFSRCTVRRTVVWLVLLISGRSVTAQEDEKRLPPEQIEFFEQKIRPVLVKHCYQCHSAAAKKVQGGLLLDSRAATLKGGDSGPAVVPEQIEESLLIAALRQESFEMPPKGKLPAAVVADFVKWVKMGAPDPRAGEVAAPSAIDFAAARQNWPFRPVVSPPLPPVKRADWPQSVVDYFTLAKMESAGVSPVAAAGKQELIRRATYDLTGLPPKPAEVAAFLGDTSPAAFAKVVDRLLSSQHYGERWGRYWLDVARYAEDQAHTFAVKPNTNGFRYRDWVISAFNSDMPYDRFVKLQIAGDLLGPVADQSYDHLVALGFFGLGAQYYKNSDAAKAAADELDDRVDTLTRAFLGLTVSCARCHDHKFDPIPTQDYYSLAGIFKSSKLHNAPLCDPAEIATYNTGQQEVKNRDGAVKKYVAAQKTVAAEAKREDVARYIKAVWQLRVAQRSGQPVKVGEVARKAGLPAFLLKRWVEFLDPKNKGKVPAFDSWFALLPAAAEATDEIPAAVSDVALRLENHLQRLLDQRDGKQPPPTTGPQVQVKHMPGSPRFASDVITKAKPAVKINIDIRGAKELYLVVTDAGNGQSCDHADWLDPQLIGPDGATKLTDLKWKSAQTGFGKIQIDKSVGGVPLKVGGKNYPHGIGTHAPSVIVYDLPPGYERFQVTGGLDHSGSDQGACGANASIQFRVYTEAPADTRLGGAELLTAVFGDKGLFAIPDKQLAAHLPEESRSELKKLRDQLAAARKAAPAMYPIAHTIAEGKIEDMKVFARGNPANQRELAPRRFLKVLAGDDPPLFTQGSGRRELADAIASPENPLTARLMVNRIWQHHFGRGIVATPSNFGKLGEAPTHPELLDYLADRFLKSGWSVRTIHREIMLSATYRASTQAHGANTNIDADNRWLWRMNRRRLDVEAWRGALLGVSGRLDRTMGGASTNLADAGNVRRTIYAKISRHELDSLLRLFDFPDANITSSKRSQTTVPQQQLFVLNSPFMIEQAKSFAARLHREEPATDRARIQHAFALAFGRAPSALEMELGLAYLAGSDGAGSDGEQNKMTRWERYTQILLGGNEFMYLD